MSRHESTTRFWQIPRVRLQSRKIRTQSNVSSSKITVSSKKSQGDEIAIIQDRGGGGATTGTVISQNIQQQHSLPIDINTNSKAENNISRRDETFQGPANLYSLVPMLGKQRCVLNIIKFPSLITIICGCILEWSNVEYFPDLFAALAIISIVSGSYSLLITWILCGQSNFQHTPGDTSVMLTVKIVQTCGSAIFAGAQIVLALLTIFQIDGDVVVPDSNITINQISQTVTVGSTITATFPTYSSSNVLIMAWALIAAGLWIMCLATVAMVYAAMAKTRLRKELEFRENRNQAFANALNFSFGKRLRVHIV